MDLIVAKFGGTSVGNGGRIKKAAESIAKEYKKGKQVVVVVSAVNKTTDDLIKLADAWCEDSSIALTYMHLMATELDLGSCWVQVHLRNRDGKNSEEIVRDILKVDSHYRIVGILAIGHSDDIPEPHNIGDIDKNKIHFLV